MYTAKPVLASFNDSTIGTTAVKLILNKKSTSCVTIVEAIKHVLDTIYVLPIVYTIDCSQEHEIQIHNPTLIPKNLIRLLIKLDQKMKLLKLHRAVLQNIIILYYI